VDASHPDIPLLQELSAAIQKAGGGEAAFNATVKSLFRSAIDEVIDTRRTNRFTIAELEKTEKTYIGTKIEILLRNWLKIPRGAKLDLQINGHEVDIKNTIASTWTIPPEAIGHVCILLRCDESKALCWVGLIRIVEEILNLGKNRDGKSTITADALKKSALWILAGEPYPPTFWSEDMEEVRQRVMQHRGGTERLVELFKSVQRRPISRSIVEAIAQQGDSLKRLRRNGGARDRLAKEGIAILWGQRDRNLIAQLELGAVSRGEFISVSATNDETKDILRRAGRID
jgi:hypothetical protein